MLRGGSEKSKHCSERTDVDKWASTYGLHAWNKRVRTSNLNPTAACVLWEQIVNAEEINDTLEYRKVFY